MRMTGHRWSLLACLLFGLAAWLTPGAAGAQESETYYVVQLYPEGIDGIVVSLGEDSGAAPGQRVRIYRAVQAKHPVTGKKLADKFPLGEVELIEIGKTLSVCEDLPELEDDPAVTATLKAEGQTATLTGIRKKSRIRIGDQVELVGAPKVIEMPSPAGGARLPWADAKPAPAIPTKCPEVHCPECTAIGGQIDQPTVAALDAWRNTLGRPIGARIEIWESFLHANPESPYRKNVTSEIHSLKLQKAESKRLAAAAKAPAKPRQPEKPEEPPLLFKHKAPDKIYKGQPLHLAVAASRIEPIRHAELFYRAVDSPTYRKKPLKRDGDAYMRVQLAEKEIDPPGVDYFFEAVDKNGEVVAVTASKEAPRRVKVEPPPGLIKVDRRDRSRVTLLYEYVDFRAGEGREGPGQDNFQRFEADFLYRIMAILYSIRIGCGVYTGQGGKIDVAGHDTVGFNYGYTELEFRFHELFSMMGRVILGLNRPAGRDAAGLGGGFEGKVRIGREMGTNLVLGGAILEDIGVLGLIELTWDVVKYFPMTGRVEVTTQPVQEDIGVRIIYQVGLSALDWFHPTLNVGVALRRIDHYGFSLGLGTVFKW